MGRSTFISAALHTAVLLWVLVAFPAAKLDHAPLLSIPVDLATPSEVTKIKSGTKDAKDDAPLAGKPKEERPEAVREAEAKKPAEQTAPAEEKAETQPKPDGKKSEEKPPKPKQAEIAPKKPTPPKPKAKPDFTADRIAALLNKIPDAANEPAPVLPSEEPPRKQVQGQSNGTEMTMSVNEIDALRARIAQCWSPPPGGLGAEQIVVKLRLKLNEDGTLVGYPTVANSGSSPFFQAAADSAVRAVYQCQPYALASDKYALWRDMILNFDPSEMYRAG